MNRSLFGESVESPKRGFMEFNWLVETDREFDEMYNQALQNLEQFGVDTNMISVDKMKRIATVVTTDDMAKEISNVLKSYGFDCINAVFDTDSEESPEDYYPEPNSVQDS